MISHAQALADISRDHKTHPQAGLIAKIMKHPDISDTQKTVLCLCLISRSHQDFLNGVRRTSRGSDNGVDMLIRKTLSSVPSDMAMPLDVMSGLGFRHYQGQFYYLPGIYEKNKSAFADVKTWPQAEQDVFARALDHMAAGMRADPRINLNGLRHLAHILSGKQIEDSHVRGTQSDWVSASEFIKYTGLMNQLRPRVQDTIKQISEPLEPSVSSIKSIPPKRDHYQTPGGVTLPFIRGVSNQKPEPDQHPAIPNGSISAPHQGTKITTVSYFSPEAMASAKALRQANEISDISYQYFLAASRMEKPTLSALAKAFETTQLIAGFHYVKVKTCLKEMDVEIPRLG